MCACVFNVGHHATLSSRFLRGARACRLTADLWRRRVRHQGRCQCHDVHLLDAIGYHVSKPHHFAARNVLASDYSIRLGNSLSQIRRMVGPHLHR